VEVSVAGRGEQSGKWIGCFVAYPSGTDWLRMKLFVLWKRHNYCPAIILHKG
jgi:hypothetical protein